MKNSSLKSADWWDEPETVPVAQIKHQGRWHRRLIKVFIWASVLLMPLLILTTAALASLLLTSAEEPNAAGRHAGASEQVAQARVLVEDWLGQEPGPVPDGRVVSFLGSTAAPVSSDGSDDGDDAASTDRLVTYTFAVTAPTGLYQASIQLAQDATGGVHAVADPALIPMRAAGADNGDLAWPWPGIESAPSAEEFDVAVSSWAAAFTSGDPATLKQTVGDPHQDHTYLPMSGVTFSEIQIEQVGALWGEKQTEDTRPKQVIMRINVTPIWSGADDTENDTDPAMVSYDVLLDRANTASPVVVAWGPPGPHTALEPYGNAVPGTSGDGTAASPLNPADASSTTIPSESSPPEATSEPADAPPAASAMPRQDEAGDAPADNADGNRE